MCMVYYLGSECDASLTTPWSEANPTFHVSELRDCDLAVRRHLAFPCVRYIGAHTGCGCGFRRIESSYTNDDPDDIEEDRAAQTDHDDLVTYLRALPPQSRAMQIYGVWSGDESQPPEHFRSCPIAELSSPDFGFRERELLTLVADSSVPVNADAVQRVNSAVTVCAPAALFLSGLFCHS